MPTRPSTSENNGQRRRRRGLLAAGVATVLVVAPATFAVAHAGSIAKSAQTKAIAAVVGAGLMQSTPRGFQPNAPATRGQLALALQRSAPRIALASVGSSVGASSSAELGAVRLKIDGAPGKNQAVLLTFNGQLDHDNALSAGCFPSFSVTRNASPTVVGLADPGGVRRRRRDRTRAARLDAVPRLREDGNVDELPPDADQPLHGNALCRRWRLHRAERLDLRQR